MRSVNKLMFAAGLATGLLAGDQAPQVPQATEVNAIAEHAATMQQAKLAREAIAARYASCGITKVLDFQEAGAQSGAQQDKPRDKVVVKVKVRESAAALAAMRQYDTDSTVRWHSPDMMARERTAQQSGEYALGKVIPNGSTVGTESGQITSTELYPYASRTQGEVGVFAVNGTETFDDQGGKYYSNFHATYCGTIVLKTLADGERQWQLDPYAEPVEDVTYNKECPIVPDASQPGASYIDC
jgi:hypothetical protein